jgi:Icc protein
MSQIKVPIHYLRGNHDDAKSIQSVLMGKDEVNDYLYYDFEAKGVHVVCLDSNGPLYEEALVDDPPGGTVTQEQLDWLDEICSSEDEGPLVIAVHHNALPVQVPWMDTWMRMENGEDFHAIVRQARDRLCGVFFGHIHQNFQVLRDGVLYVSAGSSWCQFISYPMPENTMHITDTHSLASFNIVTISEGTTSINRHSFTVEQDDVQ